MHPRNRHQDRYDFPQLCKVSPQLEKFLMKNTMGETTIDFSDPNAVKTLNAALLKHLYKIDWDLPDEFLCPPVPGRADYVHHLSDLFPDKKTLQVLDVGVGANIIYPVIGISEYGWNFTGSDINKKALKHADKILQKNPNLRSRLQLRHQPEASSILNGVILPGEHFDVSMCNPPFHASEKEALEGTTRKWRNLGKKDALKKAVLNFGGSAAELWTKGGEKAFLLNMIKESAFFQHQVTWFTTLVSKSENLPILKRHLEKLPVKEVRVIEMSQGNKKSRILAWTYGLGQ